MVGDRPYTFHGSYHGVTAPIRIVYTSELPGDPGRPTRETLNFVDLDGDGMDENLNTLR